jgi:hypothetical protein
MESATDHNTVSTPDVAVPQSPVVLLMLVELVMVWKATPNVVLPAHIVREIAISPFLTHLTTDILTAPCRRRRIDTINSTLTAPADNFTRGHLILLYLEVMLLSYMTHGCTAPHPAAVKWVAGNRRCNTIEKKLSTIYDRRLRIGLLVHEIDHIMKCNDEIWILLNTVPEDEHTVTRPTTTRPIDDYDHPSETTCDQHTLCMLGVYENYNDVVFFAAQANTAEIVSAAYTLGS